MRVIGLMSGTSADAVDAAMVEWPEGGGAREFRLIAFREDPLPLGLQERVHALAAERVAPGGVLRELAALDVELGECFARAAAGVAAQAELPLAAIDAIASHGQTVAHHPDLHASLQIGSASLIAERTGCTTVGDFRSRDLAAGGEGAPLAPFFHFVAFAESEESRLVLNLGGIANVTWIPKQATSEDVTAFDVGPANSLVDGVVRCATEGRERMDRGGERARRGSVDKALLARLMDDEFLRRPPPKSTGRERYGRSEAEALYAEWSEAGRNVDDLVATLVEFTAASVGQAVRFHLGADGLDRLLLGGGGARNPVLVERLEAALPGVAVQSLDEHGVPAAAVEAMAFALMGRNTLLGEPNHLPRCTGAGRAVVLGQIVPGGLRV